MVIVYRSLLNPWEIICRAIINCALWIKDTFDHVIEVIQQSIEINNEEMYPRVSTIYGFISLVFGAATSVVGIILKFNFVMKGNPELVSKYLD